MFPVLMRSNTQPRLQNDPFESVLRFFGDECNASRSSFPVDVSEDENGYCIQADLPGYQQKDLDITFEDSVLTIAINHCEETEEKNEQFHVRERRTGCSKRAFRLPDDVNPETIKAKLEHGVLQLDIQKREEAKPRKIDVNVE